MIELPEPTRDGQTSLEAALTRRRSVREFRSRRLTDDQLSQLLWSLQGVTNRQGDRTAPSAGALFPLEVYVARSDGLFHYEPRRHALHPRSEEDVRPAMHRAALKQDCVLAAPAVFVITAVPGRMVRKYGKERSPRYVQMECGHAAQNLLLEAVAMGLGAVPVGAFDDEAIAKLLGLPAGEEPLYLIPVGRPR